MSVIPHKRHTNPYFSSGSDDDVPEPAMAQVTSGYAARHLSRQSQAPVSMHANQAATDNPSDAQIEPEAEEPKNKRRKKYVLFFFPSVE